MDERYREIRRGVEVALRAAAPVGASAKTHVSPSGRYQLVVSLYGPMGPNRWKFSKGVVSDLETGSVITEVFRNHSLFWHAWVEHPNGNEYLLCGEDYQGYTVINLTQNVVHVHYPEAAYDGAGFCWVDAMPSPDGLMLAVEGCFWACDADIVFYDFRDPDSLPLRELKRFEVVLKTKGWKDNGTFVLTQQIEVRKSDGVRYDTLEQAEQDRLDADQSLVDYINLETHVPRPSV